MVKPIDQSPPTPQSSVRIGVPDSQPHTELAHSEWAWPHGLVMGRYRLPPGEKRETVSDSHRLIACWSGLRDGVTMTTQNLADDYTLEWKTPLDFSCLWINPSWLESHTGMCQLPRFKALCHPALLDCMRRLTKAASQGFVSALWIETQVLVCIQALVDVSGSRVKCRMKLGAEQMRRIADFVWTTPGAALSAEKLAGLAGLSVYHFSRAFTATVGLSPWQYVIAVRRETAKMKITISKQSMAEIAAELGFADQSHLTRLFTKRFGITPEKFRYFENSKTYLASGKE